MELTKANIAKQIAQLKGERDQFVVEANKQLAALNGGIQALELLIAESPKESPKTEIEKEIVQQ